MHRYICFSIFILLITSNGVADEWNQFRGPNRDGKSTETGLLKSWPKNGPPMLWFHEGVGRGFSTVSISDGVIYTTGMIDETGYLFAIHEDGNLKWKIPYGPEWVDPYPGTRTTPTIDGDRIYIMSGHGRLACFQKDKGDLIWKVDTLDKFQGDNITWGIAESVLIDGDKLYCTPGGQNATMVALNKFTGETLWTTNELSNLSAYCSPILVESSSKRLLFSMVRDLFICVNSANGDVFWTIPHSTRNNIAAITPVIIPENRIYFTSHGTGGTMIQYQDDGSEYTELWTSNELDSLHGGIVSYAPDGESLRLYGSDTRDYWICQDAKNGKVLFKEKIIRGKGSITYADGMLYCYSEKGTLGLVKPTKEGMELVSSFVITMGNDQHWAYPVIHNGRLYIRHGNVLMVFDVRGG